jgi:hypothetical protein
MLLHIIISRGREAGGDFADEEGAVAWAGVVVWMKNGEARSS